MNLKASGTYVDDHTFSEGNATSDFEAMTVLVKGAVHFYWLIAGYGQL